MIAEIHLPAKKVQTLYSIIEFNNKHEATAPEQLSFEILVGINPYPAPLKDFFFKSHYNPKYTYNCISASLFKACCGLLYSQPRFKEIYIMTREPV